MFDLCLVFKEIKKDNVVAKNAANLRSLLKASGRVMRNEIIYRLTPYVEALYQEAQVAQLLAADSP